MPLPLCVVLLGCGGAYHQVDEEHRLILRQCAEENDEAAAQQKAYDALTLIQKVEIFNNALAATPGRDLYDVLWVRSQVRTYTTLPSAPCARAC